MMTKDHSVETEFHPILTAFLFDVDKLYRNWNNELVITSGSEHSTRHSYTSLHYATPAQAADIRSWTIGSTPAANKQWETIMKVAVVFCERKGIPSSWIEVILESTHIHIEYQPKRA